MIIVIISLFLLFAWSWPARAAQTLDQLIAGAKKENDLFFVAGSETFGGRKGFAELESAFNKKFGTKAAISFAREWGGTQV